VALTGAGYANYHLNNNSIVRPRVERSTLQSLTGNLYNAGEGLEGSGVCFYPAEAKIQKIYFPSSSDITG
jgi:hypothetical protein